MDKVNDDNVSPYIIASGYSYNEIQQFFIVVEKHLIKVRLTLAFKNFKAKSVQRFLLFARHNTNIRFFFV